MKNMLKGDIVQKTYSIAKARDHFTEIVREVEQESTIKLTRRGKLVAFLLSADEYNRLHNRRLGFWEAYQPFRTQMEEQEITLDVDAIFQDVRDHTAGSPAEW